MKLSDRGLEFLKQQEGVRREMYRDFIGLPTIGVGHLLTKDELSSGKLHIGGELIDWHIGLSEEQVNDLLRADVTPVEQVINADAPAIGQYQFDSLVSFVFNVGVGAYSRSTLRKLLLLGQLAEIPQQFARWVYAGGVQSPILERRRKAESELWKRPDVAA